MKLNSDIQTLEDKIGFAVIVIAVIIYNICLFQLLWRGIRSLMKKTLNLPPSGIRWEKVYADVIREDIREDIIPPEPECFQDAHTMSTGKSSGNVSLIRISQSYKVRYEYDGQFYETEIKGNSVKGDKAVIYCRRKKPAISKEFIPEHPMPTEAAISMLFIAAFMIFFELVPLLIKF